MMLIQKFEEKDIFNYALALSLFIHTVTFFTLSILRSPVRSKPFKTIEVTYRIIDTKKEIKAESPSQTKGLQMDKAKQDFKEMLSKASLPNSFIHDNKKITRRELMSSKKGPSLLDTAYSHPKISIPVFKSEKMTDPQYLSYENKIRNKIRNRAYLLLEQLMTQANFEEGEVYLTFLIGADGVLKDIKIIEEKTKANGLLRRISLMSVKESSPFPSLPNNKYPEITYNITISYELGKGE